MNDADSDVPGRPGHPGLTISVYRIDPVTLTRTQVGPTRTIPPADPPLFSAVFPPCACPRCSARPGEVP